jgi:hypothetical protein
MRTQKGTLAEFAPALLIFICFVLLPAIDIAFIPVRYLIAQGVMNETAHRLALADTRTEANNIAHEGWWTDFLKRCGVVVHPQPLRLIVGGVNPAEPLVLLPSQPVPAEWLPTGAKAPCTYIVEMTAQADIGPLCNGSSGLPGFTAPVHLTLNSRSNWENLGRDPANHQYFINE